MDADAVSQTLAASIAANASIEAARITAAATIKASENTLFAAFVAIAAAFSAIAAAYINTWQHRRTYKARREAYRHLIGGILQTLRSDISASRYMSDHALGELRAGRPSTLRMYATPLPEELAADKWRRHAILGPEFARTIVPLRVFLSHKKNTDHQHASGWDLSKVSTGFFTTEMNLERYLSTLKALERVLETLEGCTKTHWERVRSQIRGPWRDLKIGIKVKLGIIRPPHGMASRENAF